MSLRSPGSIHGVGIGLRHPHLNTLLGESPPAGLPWLEILADNFLYDCAISQAHLSAVCSRWPVTFHCVGMSLGSTDSLNWVYLNQLKKLIARYEPVWVSDHLSWSSVHGQYVPDLLPLPYTMTTVQHVSDRIQEVQSFLGQKILIENVSTYAQYNESTLEEAEFVSEVVKAADCLLLCDVNNIYVSAYNHDFSPEQYLQKLPANRVIEYHLAGYEQRSGYLYDNHGSAVHEPVWALYQKALNIIGPRPTCIEWDTHIPSFNRLAEQRDRAQALYEHATHTTKTVS